MKALAAPRLPSSKVRVTLSGSSEARVMLSSSREARVTLSGSSRLYEGLAISDSGCGACHSGKHLQPP